ncbi:MAG TPA: FecR domain-containing protein, partial [Spirochaetota bacterium]|nr:FecR domain-containing protein [Spirochaetota bacterium]
MSLSSKDIIVTGIALAIISSSSYGLYRDFVQTSSGTQKQIGTITYKKKTAERKFTSRSTWENLSQQAPVYNRDSIRTAEGASAVINLSDGTVLDLDENTLVMLNVDESESSVSVGSGSLYAKSGSDSALTMKAKGTSVSMKKGALSLALGKDDMKLNMLSGGASVKAGGSVQTLSGSDGLRLAGGKMENTRPDVILESPAPSTFIPVAKGKKADIRFSWKGQVDKPSILIGRNRSLTNADKVKAAGTTGTKALAAGEYYWGVVSGKGNVSDVRKFVIVEDSEIKPLSPKGDVFTSVDEKPIIPLRWSESALASLYEIEVSKDRSFRDVLKSVKTKNTSISFDRRMRESISGESE